MHKLQFFSSAKGPPSLQPALGQACDQCRRRKSRCNRAHPCTHCERTEQRCSYDVAPKTRGRRPRRKAGVESETSSKQLDESLVPPATSWIDTLPDLSCYMEPSNQGFMDDQPLPLTPASFGWQTPSLGSSTVFTGELAKTPSHHESTWCEPVERPFQLLSRQCFVPYAHLFFERLYAVFPVVEKESLLETLESPQQQSEPLPSSIYMFLTALSAAVIVQLNVDENTDTAHTDSTVLSNNISTTTAAGPLTSALPSLSADLFVAQCLETRRSVGFIEDADEWTILTSFFLFEYYGNRNQPKSAWYYLREAIGFAQSLGLDDASMYVGLDAKTSQQRKLLFWLLFVTERAYALQHRSRVMIRQTIDLPHIFESSHPKLMYGFVTLARVFSIVDNAFIAAWRSQNTPMILSAGDARSALSKLLREDVEFDAVAVGEMNETQRLDILVTQQWLKTLAWQLQASLDSSISSSIVQGAASAVSGIRDSSSVIEAAKNLLDVVYTASSPSLEAHGIGMEQKVSDVANCLCDVLESPGEPDIVLDFFSTQDFLHQFMVFLADFRRRESQYLQPLLRRASTSLYRCIQPPRPLLLGEEEDAWTGRDFPKGADQAC